MIAHKIAHHVCPHVVSNNDLVLVYAQNHEDLGTWKFDSMWCGPRHGVPYDADNDP
jgi:hypothetical protein